MIYKAIRNTAVGFFLVGLLWAGLSPTVQAQRYRTPAHHGSESPYSGPQQEREIGSLPDWAESSAPSNRSQPPGSFSAETKDDPTPPPGEVQDIPVDSHIGWLFSFGLLYGFYRVRKKEHHSR